MTINANGIMTNFGDLTCGRELSKQEQHVIEFVVYSVVVQQIHLLLIKLISMEYITIASTGNGQDFGDLSAPRDRVGHGFAISDSHGGLGGF